MNGGGECESVTPVRTYPELPLRGSVSIKAVLLDALNLASQEVLVGELHTIVERAARMYNSVSGIQGVPKQR